jgi:hypothetical protein
MGGRLSCRADMPAGQGRSGEAERANDLGTRPLPRRPRRGTSGIAVSVERVGPRFPPDARWGEASRRIDASGSDCRAAVIVTSSATSMIEDLADGQQSRSEQIGFGSAERGSVC